jgi:hypothetical protein
MKTFPHTVVIGLFKRIVSGGNLINVIFMLFLLQCSLKLNAKGNAEGLENKKITQAFKDVNK